LPRTLRFRVICKSDRDLFLRDLRTLGLEEHYGALSEVGLEVDESYEAVRLTVNSNQEYKIIKDGKEIIFSK
jgi:hypothetical protein